MRKFFPVPPNTSFPTTTPKAIPKATCHKGVEAGKVSAKSMEETKKPSLTSCPLIVANVTSHIPPAIKVVR